MTKQLYVVIDPNVWVSGLINPTGAPARVLEAVMSGRIIAVVSPHLLGELADVLARPRLRRWVTVEDALALVEALAETADLQSDPDLGTKQVRDPDDDYLIALTEANGAVLVTGDADLLDAGLTPPAISPRTLLSDLGLS